MNIFLNLIILVVGFILLIKGADAFVDGASSTASNFKVPKMLIGLTIVAFGTSAPEFAVSVSALASGNNDMVLGNVIGSCILNILLILGIAALIRPIKVNDNTVRKELPLCMLISILLAVVFLDTMLGDGQTNLITRADALVLLLFFAVFLYYLVTLAKRKPESKAGKDEKPQFTLKKSLLFVAVGMIGIIVGSQMVVNGASSIAEAVGISERMISLTIIAFGTSLPELVTSVIAAKRGEQDLAVGNIIGSNIFNICIVLGLPVAFFGTVSSASFQMLDIFMLVSSAILLFIFALSSHKITRAEGAFMLVAFAIYYTAIIFI